MDRFLIASNASRALLAVSEAVLFALLGFALWSGHSSSSASPPDGHGQARGHAYSNALRDTGAEREVQRLAAYTRRAGTSAVADLRAADVLQRDGKFPWTGPAPNASNGGKKALSASLLALPFMLLFALRAGHLHVWGRWLFLALLQAAAMFVVWALVLPLDHHLTLFGAILFALLLLAQMLIFGNFLAAGFELLEALAQPDWRRRASPCPVTPGFAPKVSVHVACHNEPPQQVIATLDSLRALDYPDYEVLVIDNNTRDEALWQPVWAHCQVLGERFRFFHLDNWPGFKAGALNFALRHTDPGAEIVAVLDSDYQVRPDWLAQLAGHFADPQVGAVQAPQAHREYAHHPFRRMCNAEGESFFRVGMHHRHERDAIIVHGTLIMFRRALLDRLGWSEWCVCEDTELGLRVQRAGYQVRYVDRPYGQGLAPEDFAAYKTQRFRWAFGAMQIFRGHLSSLLRTCSRSYCARQAARVRCSQCSRIPHTLRLLRSATSRLPSLAADREQALRPGGLTLAQRYHYLAGWLPWFAGAGHLIVAVCAIALSVGQWMMPTGAYLPFQAVVAAATIALGLKSLSTLVLHRACVRSRWRDTFAALVAELALTHTIARAVLRSLVTLRLPFRRTAKGASLAQANAPGKAVIEEFGLFMALWLCILALLSGQGAETPLAKAWLAVLAAQSLPYAAALYCEWLGSREAPRHREKTYTLPSSRPSRAAERAAATYTPGDRHERENRQSTP